MVKQYIVHRVDPFKESLSIIARRYGVSEVSIKAANNIPYGDASANLFIMPELLVPYSG